MRSDEITDSQHTGARNLSLASECDLTNSLEGQVGSTDRTCRCFEGNRLHLNCIPRWTQLDYCVSNRLSIE